MGGVRAVGAAARTSVARHLSPRAGESGGAEPERWYFYIVGFEAGMRLEGGLGRAKARASMSLRYGPGIERAVPSAVSAADAQFE